MRPIRTEPEFQQMLESERAIALTCFEWSGQSKMSEKLVEQWERDWLSHGPFQHVPLYRISPDETWFLHGWLVENARNDHEGMEGGFGSVMWLKRGRAVRFVRYAVTAGADVLSGITEEVFKD